MSEDNQSVHNVNQNWKPNLQRLKPIFVEIQQQISGKWPKSAMWIHVKIRQWVREERLIFSADSAMGIECEKCGKSIRTGRFCDDCKRDTANELSGAYQSHKVEEDAPSKKVVKNRMRFLDKEHRN